MGERGIGLQALPAQNSHKVVGMLPSSGQILLQHHMAIFASNNPLEFQHPSPSSCGTLGLALKRQRAVRGSLISISLLRPKP